MCFAGVRDPTPYYNGMTTPKRATTEGEGDGGREEEPKVASAGFYSASAREHVVAGLVDRTSYLEEAHIHVHTPKTRISFIRDAKAYTP